jgi:hypothetical protein
LEEFVIDCIWSEKNVQKPACGGDAFRDLCRVYNHQYRSAGDIS